MYVLDYYMIKKYVNEEKVTR